VNKNNNINWSYNQIYSFDVNVVACWHRVFL